jgi:hypothetical protein
MQASKLCYELDIDISSFARVQLVEFIEQLGLLARGFGDDVEGAVASHNYFVAHCDGLSSE